MRLPYHLDALLRSLPTYRQNKQETLIFISHRFSTIKDAGRIIVLHKGRIIEDGTHKQLMRLGGKYAQLYSIQAQRFKR